jgi:hypothetical protein
MKVVKSVKLTVNDYKAVTLPCEYVDLLRVGIPAGQYLHPMTSEENMNRLNNYDATGKKIPFENTFPQGNVISVIDLSLTDKGVWSAQKGGIFNHNPGKAGANYVELLERNEIQLDPDFPYTEIVIDFIDDGQSCDAATRIHPYAQATIEAYMIWQLKANNRSYQPGEVQYEADRFDKQLRILRARMSGLTPEDIVMAARKGYSGVYKGF